jgi:hypothetical protein
VVVTGGLQSCGEVVAESGRLVAVEAEVEATAGVVGAEVVLAGFAAEGGDFGAVGEGGGDDDGAHDAFPWTT